VKLYKARNGNIFGDIARVQNSTAMMQPCKMAPRW